MLFVLDASFALAWYLPAEATDYTAQPGALRRAAITR